MFKKCSSLDFFLFKNSTQEGFNVQRLHNTRVVSSAVKVSSLSKVYHKELLWSSCSSIRDCFKYQTLFKDSAILQDVQSLHLDLHHIIFNLPNSHRIFPFFSCPSRSLLSTHYSHNQSHAATNMQTFNGVCFFLSENKADFSLPFDFLIYSISVRLTNISLKLNSACMSEINRCIHTVSC